MRLDIQYRIFEDPRQRMFLRENSYWYKILNRYPDQFTKFEEEVKEKFDKDLELEIEIVGIDNGRS